MQSQNKNIIGIIICLLLAGCATNTTTTRADKATTTALEPLLEESYLAYREGRLGDAESLLLKVLEQHPTLAEAWFKLANVYYRTSRYDAAVRAYEKTVAYDKENGRAWYNLALTKIKQADVVLKAGALQLRKDNPYVRRLVSFRSRLNSRFKPAGSKPATTGEAEPRADLDSPQRTSQAESRAGLDLPRRTSQAEPQADLDSPRRTSKAKPQTGLDSPRRKSDEQRTKLDTTRRKPDAQPTKLDATRRISEAPRRKPSKNSLFTVCPSCASW